MTENKIQESTDKNKHYSGFSSYGLQYLGNNINACGDIHISTTSFFNIIRTNAEAQAYKNKIVGMTGQDGIYIERGADIITEGKEIEKIKTVFNNPSFRNFKDKYFTQRFCSGEIYIYPKTMATGEIYAQILDSRALTKQIDEYGDIIAFRNYSKSYSPDDIYHNIILEDPNRPGYGLSIFEGVVWDAFADIESAKRQVYYFKNSAVPNSLIMLDQETIKDDEELQNMVENFKRQFGGNNNSNKFLMNPGIKDVKILELTNRDLDLLNLRKFSIQKMGVIFQLDPRLIGFKDGGGGNNAEIKEVRKEGSEIIIQYAYEMEQDMNGFYKKFVDHKFEGMIRLSNDSFEDYQESLDLIVKQIRHGMITPKKGSEMLGYNIEDMPEETDRYYMEGSVQPLQNNNNNKGTERSVEQI